MPERKLNLVGQTARRTFEVERSNVDEESRTVELSFSSNAEITRGFGIEVLDHAEGSVMLDRLNSGAPLLVNHDTRDQVGVVESVRIDGSAVGRASVRFSRSTRGEEIFQDVKDGIRRLVSVGYQIHEWEERETKTGLHVRVTKWEPFEVSIVPIPADISVGVGRSEALHETKGEKTMTTEATTVNETNVETRSTDKPATFDIHAEREKTKKAELERQRKIRSMADANNLEELGRRAVSEDWTYEQFNEKALEEIGERNRKARSESQESGDVGLSDREKKSFSFVRLMNALSNPQDRAAQQRAGFELSVSDEAVKKLGGDFKARGAFIPDEVLNYGKRDLNVTTATAGGNLVGSTLMAGSFIELLRNAQITAQLGVQTLSGLVGLVEVPRQTAGAAMTWLTAEDVEATESEPTFDQVLLSPKDAAVFTEVTRRLLMQSTPSIEGLVKADLAQAIGIGTDRAVMYGSAAAGQPRGIVNQTGINSVTFAAAVPTWAEVVNVVSSVMTDNALFGSIGWAIDPTAWAGLMTREKATGTAQFVMNESNTIAGYRSATSNQVTAGDHIFGNWGSVVVGEWGGLEMNIDPYTHALRGRVRYIVFKTMDVAVRHPASFCLGNDGV